METSGPAPLPLPTPRRPVFRLGLIIACTGLIPVLLSAKAWWFLQQPTEIFPRRLSKIAKVKSPGLLDQKMAREKFGTYQDACASAEVTRRHLANRLDKATTGESRAAVLNDARAAFVNALARNLIPFWYGTEWDFNGTTQTPGTGKIACGYFVTTTLCHSGVKMNRVLTAQQASQCIIKTLTTKEFLRTGHRVAISDYVRQMQEWGPGLYVVGLDSHVGFLWVEGKDAWFIHSNGGWPREVIKERALDSPALSQSRYRIAGKISDDDALLTSWLQGSWRETVLETTARR